MGIPEIDAFIQTVLALRLVEPVDINLWFDDGRSMSLGGLYIASLDALAKLGNGVVLDLLRRGYLQLTYAMPGSLKQVSILAQLRNERLAV